MTNNIGGSARLSVPERILKSETPNGKNGELVEKIVSKINEAVGQLSAAEKKALNTFAPVDTKKVLEAIRLELQGEDRDSTPLANLTRRVKGQKVPLSQAEKGIKKLSAALPANYVQLLAEDDTLKVDVSGEALDQQVISLVETAIKDGLKVEDFQAIKNILPKKILKALGLSIPANHPENQTKEPVKTPITLLDTYVDAMGKKSSEQTA